LKGSGTPKRRNKDTRKIQRLVNLPSIRPSITRPTISTKTPRNSARHCRIRRLWIWSCPLILIRS
jgi:transposase InsO family protein